MSRHRHTPRLPDPVERVGVESLAHDGRGVAHIGGKAVFIDGALPGETVAIDYLATHRSYDEARVRTVHEPSSHRVVPRCPHFGVCGGCSLQHLEAEEQIMAKQQVLLDNLKRIGRVSPDEVLPPLRGPVWGYRGKARLGIKDVIKKGRVLVGFREKRSPYLADLRRCEVLHPSVGKHIPAIAGLIVGLEARSRIPQVEVAVTDSVTALVFRHLDALGEADLERLKAFARDQGFHVYLQSGGPDSVRPLWPEDATLSYALPAEGIELDFRPTDFTQINSAINRLMVGRVLQLLEPAGSHRVLDLFCGLGNFTLPLARHAGEAVGVEGDAGLVARARHNAIRNGIGNAAFHLADLATSQIEASWAGKTYERILLDPPRSGATAALDIVGNIRPGRVVYVSCHPGSLARDAARLVEAFGYRLLAAGVMDMFPHTAHVESIALFEARSSRSTP
jgi:23S rRNA (uracil1939-C5)-methyltransferase